MKALIDVVRRKYTVTVECHFDIKFARWQFCGKENVTKLKFGVCRLGVLMTQRVNSKGYRMMNLCFIECDDNNPLSFIFILLVINEKSMLLIHIFMNICVDTSSIGLKGR